MRKQRERKKNSRYYFFFARSTPAATSQPPPPPSLPLISGLKVTVAGSISDPESGAELASCVAVLADLAALRRAGVGG